MLTPFTLNSPIGLEPLVSDIPPAGGIVLDLVGSGGGRIEAEVAPCQLFRGTAKCGTPASYRGDPVTLGIQTDLSPTALRSLGGGLAGVAVRITTSQGGTGPGEPERNANFLWLNGFSLGNFSTVVTEQTSPDGLTALSSNPEGGFRTGSLDTGFFSSTDPALLSGLYQSIVQTGQVVYQLQNTSSVDQSLDFTTGLACDLIHVRQPLVDAFDAPRITGTTVESPIAEGSSATLTVTARTAHEDPNHPSGLTFQFDTADNGSYAVSNSTGTVSLTFFHPGTYAIPVRVVTPQGTFATTQVSITVLNVAPTLVSPGVQSAVEGSPAQINLGRFSDPGLDSPWSLRIDWGDGTNPQSEVFLATGSLGSEVHTYELDGSYTVTELMSDSLGASVQQSFVVNVQNVPPHVDSFTVTPELTLGQTALLSLTFSDPGLQDTFHGQINWGDGSTTSFQRSAGQHTVDASHPYVLEPGKFAVSATIIDHGGGEATASATVVVTGSPAILNTLGAIAATPNAEYSTLAFFNSSSSPNPPTTAAPPVTIAGRLFASVPGQGFSSGKPSTGRNPKGPPKSESRSLEELLALLLENPLAPSNRKRSGTGSSTSATSAAVVAQSTEETPGMAQSSTHQGALLASASGAGGVEEPISPASAASRILLIVIWTLSVGRQRFRVRLRRYSSGFPGLPSMPRV